MHCHKEKRLAQREEDCHAFTFFERWRLCCDIIFFCDYRLRFAGHGRLKTFIDFLQKKRCKCSVYFFKSYCINMRKDVF